jgi:signal transduction histidine kinase
VEGATLVLEVADDGRGGAAAGEGSGLLGLSDRVEALRGRLRVTSPPGVGTTLRAEFPLAPSG